MCKSKHCFKRLMSEMQKQIENHASTNGKVDYKSTKVKPLSSLSSMRYNREYGACLVVGSGSRCVHANQVVDVAGTGCGLQLLGSGAVSPRKGFWLRKISDQHEAAESILACKISCFGVLRSSTIPGTRKPPRFYPVTPRLPSKRFPEQT